MVIIIFSKSSDLNFKNSYKYQFKGFTSIQWIKGNGKTISGSWCFRGQQYILICRTKNTKAVKFKFNYNNLDKKIKEKRSVIRHSIYINLFIPQFNFLLL